jgi:hypothetical protein
MSDCYILKDCSPSIELVILYIYVYIYVFWQGFLIFTVITGSRR